MFKFNSPQYSNASDQILLPDYNQGEILLLTWPQGNVTFKFGVSFELQFKMKWQSFRTVQLCKSAKVFPAGASWEQFWL